MDVKKSVVFVLNDEDVMFVDNKVDFIICVVMFFLEIF